MMTNERTETRRASPINVGGASLFAVLIILCLTVFAVLSKLSANSERSLAERTADSISAYYNADYRASERLAEVKEYLRSGSDLLYEEYDCETDYYDYSLVITYSENIDENRELRVKLRVTEDGVFREEWAAANKDTGESEGAPLLFFGDGDLDSIFNFED